MLKKLWAIICFYWNKVKLFKEDPKTKIPSFEEWIKVMDYRHLPLNKQLDLYDYACDLIKASNKKSNQVFVS